MQQRRDKRGTRALATVLAALVFAALLSTLPVLPASAAAPSGVLEVGQYSSGSVIWTQSGSNNASGTGATGFSSPQQVVIDPVGLRMFVSDNANNRVVVYNLGSNGLPLHTYADYVIGEPNMTSTGAGCTLNGMTAPTGLAYEASAQRLWVVNCSTRVTAYDMSALATNMNASYVIGQNSFTTTNYNSTQQGLSNPNSVAIDDVRHKLYVSDKSNSRVTIYNTSALSTMNTAATYVIGQTSYTATTAATTQAGLDQPGGVGVDPTTGYVFVGSNNSHRVTVYDGANIAANGPNAIYVLGQSDFTTSSNSGAAFAGWENGPDNMTVDASARRLYVPDNYANRVQVFDLTYLANRMPGAYAFGQPDLVTGTSGTTQTTLTGPYGVAVDPIHKYAVVADTGNNRIVFYDNTVVPASTRTGAVKATPSLGPTADGTASSGTWTQSGCSGTFYICLTDTVGVGQTSYAAPLSSTSGSYRMFTFGNLPMDIGTVTSLTLNQDVKKNTSVTTGTADTMTLTYQFFASNETTAITAAATTPALNTSFTQSSVSMSPTGPALGQQAWTNPRLKIMMNITPVGGADTTTANIASINVTLTYISTGGAVTQTGYKFENDDQASAATADANTSQAAANTAITGVKRGERVSTRVQLSDATAPTDANVSLLYDRNDNYWTKVKSSPGTAPPGTTCTDTNFLCSQLDTSTAAVGNTGVAVDKLGRPWVSYYDSSGGNLMVASYVGTGGSGCGTNTAWMCQAVAVANDVGKFNSIAIDNSNNVWVSYYDATNSKLMVAENVASAATCGTGGSSDWTCTIVVGATMDTTNGDSTQIAIDPTNSPAIVYHNTGGSNDIMYTRYVGSGGGSPCTSSAWSYCTSPDSSNSGQTPALAFDRNGTPWYADRSPTGGVLEAGRADGGSSGAAGWTFSGIDNTIAYRWPAIAFDNLNTAWVGAYDSTNKKLRAAHFGSGACTDTAWTCSIIDGTTADMGQYVAAATDAAGHPWFAYKDATNGKLRVARYVGGTAGTGCTTSPGPWACSNVDTAGGNNTGNYNSIAFGPDGTAWISTVDTTTSRLRIVALNRTAELTSSPGLSGTTNSTILTTPHASSACASGTFALGSWVSSEESQQRLDVGNCTELGFLLDTSNTVLSRTYRLMAASRDAPNPSRGYLRGPATVSNYPTLTIESSASDRVAKDSSYDLSNCANTAWGCGVLDSTGDVGTGTSVAFDSNGNPWISYLDATNTNLKVAQYVGSGGSGCDAAATPAWSCTTIDGTSTNISGTTSIGFDATGTAWVAYFNLSTYDLKVAHYVGTLGFGCATTAGAAWTCITLDQSHDTGYNPSIAFDAQGLPWIAEYDDTSRALRIARYVGGNNGNGSCNSSSWSCNNIDIGSSGAGSYPSIAFDPQGAAWVSYLDNTTSSTKVAHYVGEKGSGCSASVAWTCTLVEATSSSTGQGTSITFDGSGNPWIADLINGGGGVRVARYVGGTSGNGNCATTAWSCYLLDTNIADMNVSIATDASGNPWVSYGSGGDFKVARYLGSGGSSCNAGVGTAWSCGAVETTNDIGMGSAIGFDATGALWGSYYDNTNHDLRIAKMHAPPTKPIVASGVKATPRSATTSGGRYRLDWGDTARPVSGGCDAAAGAAGYCGLATFDTYLDGMPALVNEKPSYTFAMTYPNNTDNFTVNWYGRSSVAPSTKAISVEIWRGGTTKAWQALTLQTDTCASASAGNDCTLSGTISANNSDYFDADGSAYRVYARVSQATNTSGAETLATNNYALAFAPTNHAPNDPSSLDQKTSANVSIVQGSWNKLTSVKFTGTVSDPDSDMVSLCVEMKGDGDGWDDYEDDCSTPVSSGSSASLTLAVYDGQMNHWHARTRDSSGAYSNWVSWGTNLDSDPDFSIDVTGPIGGTIFDGTSTGSDAAFNTGSLTTLSANWPAFSDAWTSVASYEYSIGLSAGDTITRGWTSIGNVLSYTATGLTLSPSTVYYFNVRATDTLGNVGSSYSSNGVRVLPLLTFSVASVASGASCGDVTTNALSTTTAFNFGTLATTSQHTIAGQTLGVTTNASNGYTVYTSYTGALTGLVNGVAFGDVGGTNAAPVSWPTNGTEAFGYTTQATNLSGTASRFHTSKWAAFTTSKAEVMRNTGPAVSADSNCMAYQVSRAALTKPDTYRSTVTYQVVPSF